MIRRFAANNITYPRKGLNYGLKHGSMQKLVDFPNGSVMILGYGSIGKGTLPLILRHFNMPYENIKIVTAPDNSKDAYESAERYGVNVDIVQIKKDNFEKYLSSNLKKDDLLINVSTNLSSFSIQEHCINNGILYIDTCIDEWEGYYTDESLSIAERSNYYMREELLKLKKKYSNYTNTSKTTTSISCHGATPGLSSHFVKEGLLNVARNMNDFQFDEPQNYKEWSELAKRLNIKCIQISDYDTQNAIIRKQKHKNEFVNTWSIDGLLAEAWGQPSELGFGTHEKCMPFDGEEHSYGTKASIYLKQPGILTNARSWNPINGGSSFISWLITHNDAITISDFLTARDDNGNVTYRPTCHYAYHPCEDAILSMHDFCGYGFNEDWITEKRVLSYQDIDFNNGGQSYLGTLLCGHKDNAYWFGCKTDVKDVGQRVENNQAGSIQVTAPILAGSVYAIHNKNLGIIECEEMDHKFILDIVEPYVAPVIGEYTDWTPLQNRNKLGYDESSICNEDPWQFSNIRCHDINMPFSFSNYK